MKNIFKAFFFLPILFLFAFNLSAQSVVASEDGKINITSSLSNKTLPNEAIADTITIKVSDKENLRFTELDTDKLLKTYNSNRETLSKMQLDGEPYCNLVPNCDKIFRLPIIKAVHYLGQDKYALIGYLRAKSPVTIIRHVWILDISENPVIEKRIAFFGQNANYIAFGYNLLENEIFILQHLPKANKVQGDGMFLVKDNFVLSQSGISKVPFSRSDFMLFLQKSKMQEHQDIGFKIYSIPSGEAYNRMPEITETAMPMYRISLK
ncbi:MAG: hypothetical protein ACI85I_002366 [Arenicella sp.]|jgi:hypothetical protein